MEESMDRNNKREHPVHRIVYNIYMKNQVKTKDSLS